jgi:hypothetical protein
MRNAFLCVTLPEKSLIARGPLDAMDGVTRISIGDALN